MRAAAVYEFAHPSTAANAHRQELLYAVAACGVGSVAPLELQIGGVLYASEALLAAVVLWALVTTLGDESFWKPPLTSLLACLGVTLLAYVVADLYLGTERENIFRGWARLIFLGSNFFGLYFLCRRNPFCLVLYLIASACASLVYLGWTGRFFEGWKFGASGPVTLLVVCLLPRFWQHGVLLGSITLAALGLVHVRLDSREIGGNCVLASALLFARATAGFRLRTVWHAVLAVTALSAIGMWLFTYVLASSEHGQRRQFSNAWRTASLFTAASAIADSPWIGNGSQANSFDLQSRYDAMFAERSGVRYRGIHTDTSTFSPHSQLLQAWFEAGIFATTFFFYLGWRLVMGLYGCIFRRPLDAYSVLFGYGLLRAIWHLLFSPFAGLARMDVAVVAVMLCLLAGERRAYSTTAG